MKKIFILSMILTMTASDAFSQFADNAVKFNLFGLAVGRFQLAYEKALNENSSAQLQFGIETRSWDVGGDFGFEQKDAGFVIVPEYRIYSDEALKGLYGAVFARYRTITTTVTSSGGSSSDETEYKRTAVGGGLVAGYQFLVSDKLVLDLFAGPQYKSATTELKSGVDSGVSLEGEGDGIGLRFGFNVGVVL